MASIRKRVGSTGTTYHVQIRRKGLKPITRSLSSRTVAQRWARQTESALERSEFLDLTEAKTTALSTILARYSAEVAIGLKGWSQEQSRCKGLSERLGDRLLADTSRSYGYPVHSLSSGALIVSAGRRSVCFGAQKEGQWTEP